MSAVYLVLGLPGSGRREVVYNLIADGVPEEQSVAIYYTVGDIDPAATPPAARPGVVFVPYSFGEGSFSIAEDDEPENDAEVIFFFADGRLSPIDQLEAFSGMLDLHGWELARVLLIVHCALAVAHPEVERWHEACAHFSDCILLNRRDLTSNTWAQQFQKKLHSGSHPGICLLVKNGHVDNALVALFPEARRPSLAFDKLDPLDDLEDIEEDEEFPDDILALEPKIDPYFERKPNGYRCKLVPDVTPFLRPTPPKA